jgi:uncharacterized protein (TIGR03437 family)
MMRYATGTLLKRFAPFALALLVTAGAQAATVTSTFTMNNATAALTASGFNISDQQASLTNLGAGGATVSGALTTQSSSIGSTSATANIVITFTGGSTLTGTLSIPIAALAGTGGTGAVTASLAITGGTGSYAGYSTSTPFALTGTSSLSLSTGGFSLSLSGTAAVNTSGGTTTATPTVNAVLDAASNTANIAQGSMFSVYGTNLTPTSPGLVATFPRPTVVGGVKVTFTPVTGGAGTDTYLFYVGKQSGYDQINAILPSTVPTGNYNVTVTNGTVSNQFLTPVVATKVGLFTQDQTGTGLAVVFNYISQSESDVNRLTTGTYNTLLSSPAKPGQTLVAWGTGIGAYAAGDNGTVSHDFSTSEPILAIVGGISIPVAFAGLSGIAAEDQINFTLPANIPTGCAVSLQISVNGVLSAVTYISIAPSSSATACVQPGYTTAQLQQLDNGGTITTGGFSLSQIAATVPSVGTEKIDSIGGSFTQLTAFQLAAASANYSVITSGSCEVIRVTSTGATAATHATALDAGTVTLTGPPGTNLTSQVIPESSNAYSYSIGTEGVSIPGFGGNGSILPGTYTLNGAGGTDVGPFSNVSITLGPAFTLNPGLPATVTESAGLTLNWTGGNASDQVLILGASGTITGTGTNSITSSTEFICTTTAGQKTFTVPTSILTQLPAVSAAQINANTGYGYLAVTDSVTPANFSPTLKNGGGTIPSTFGFSFIIGGQAAYQ